MVTYYDSGSGRLTLGAPGGATSTVADLGGSDTWKMAAGALGDDLIDKFKPSEALSYSDTQTWRTRDFVLGDAILTNRSNGAGLAQYAAREGPRDGQHPHGSIAAFGDPVRDDDRALRASHADRVRTGPHQLRRGRVRDPGPA